MRIGHISDFHLRRHLPGSSAVLARRSRQVPALLAEAVERLNEAGCDLVAVTGDLVDHPFEDMDGAEARRQGIADLRLVAEILDHLGCDRVVLPGNHDHPELFAEVFGPPPEDLEIAGHRVVVFHDWEGEGHVPERVDAERARFTAALADGDRRPQVHLQHYVIAPRLDEGYPHTYADGQALAARLAADGRVRLVLSGHYHRGVEPFRPDGDSGPWLCVAPAFCEPPHPFLVHDLEADGELRSARADLRPNLA